MAVLTLERGLIHSFLPAVLVRDLFAWEGATQIALGLGMLAAALRYRPPVPLFLALSRCGPVGPRTPRPPSSEC